MNKPICHFLALALAAAAVQQAWAEEQISHNLDFPKGDAAWSVTVEAFGPESRKAAPVSTPVRAAKPGDPPPGRSVRRADILRKGNVRHDMITWSDGGTTEMWWTQDPVIAFFQNPLNGTVTPMKGGDLMDQRYDESSMEWVGESTFVEMQSFRGTKCRYYRMVVTHPDGGKETWQCWVDNDTARPVAVSKGTGLVIFTFDLPIPDGPLVLPSKLESLFQRLKLLL